MKNEVNLPYPVASSKNNQTKLKKCYVSINIEFCIILEINARILKIWS